MDENVVYHWATFGLGTVAFLLTWTGMVMGFSKFVNSIKQDTAEKVTDETVKITDRINKLLEQFEAEQKTQDQQFGEVGLSLRQYVSNVEKEMHQIEIWGRDNFVLKSEFLNAIESMRTAVREMGADIKLDIRTLTAKIDKRDGH